MAILQPKRKYWAIKKLTWTMDRRHEWNHLLKSVSYITYVRLKTLLHHQGKLDSAYFLVVKYTMMRLVLTNLYYDNVCKDLGLNTRLVTRNCFCDCCSCWSMKWPSAQKLDMTWTRGILKLDSSSCCLCTRLSNNCLSSCSLFHSFSVNGQTENTCFRVSYNALTW